MAIIPPLRQSLLMPWWMRDWAGWIGAFLIALLLGFLLWMTSVHAGQQVGENSDYAREMGFEQRFFYVAAGNGTGQVEYICKAFAGMNSNDDTAAAIWQVQKFVYDSSNRISTIAFAGDNDGFDQVCDNRASLNYS